MKRLFFIPLAAITLLLSCNNDKEPGGGTTDTLKAKADSLYEVVMKGHDIGMAKDRVVKSMQQKARQALDSLGKLPAKAKAEAVVLKARVDSLLKDLQYAEFAMDKWMSEFDNGLANDSPSVSRIKYLDLEKDKISKVKEAILNSLQKADSLLK
jgi:hypothetical protein